MSLLASGIQIILRMRKFEMPDARMNLAAPRLERSIVPKLTSSPQRFDGNRRVRARLMTSCDKELNHALHAKFTAQIAGEN